VDVQLVYYFLCITGLSYMHSNNLAKL